MGWIRRGLRRRGRRRRGAGGAGGGVVRFGCRLLGRYRGSIVAFC